ncbi:UDP-2,3-diacylglucosamine diphosphatase [Solemya velum gill symbiont]|uniref:UDP-2,3-diacylglucosamine diphosphatase n=1 Tax=Solemya velum gill symbiont TaxID=2340 RepID=UPI000997940C|nr:UDP-2,3-diacylglucosamine diphosphatase [Solemya velum gill symbiont]OOZ43447.1 UDP-2,3-diacylglucosamine diphosphatase [Solemya velum gill symbiont]OOZ44874.1 UDP-2,3-diacylglucosamine diphosphatase [Solemya velum gill symbiont]OOZ48269.1 UDP-2,3-diacylglucosamine diphosphatase [Solemya velum gill symbiont]OOZ50231.1 UDP-2,3-diacylglucosamine diphosphatase [Solemya velum gill symbiont]OOZ53315.1 UDP-2,3-diacylglucosamine diphosphatase [Solemya velum gill symbiont]
MSTPESQSNEILFISDLHLSPEYPATVQRFLNFLNNRARQADAIFILGDLFDAWLGDDDNEAPYQDIRVQIGMLTSSGTEVLIQHGNRDFLLGDDFCRHTGTQLVPDEMGVDLFGTKTLLMHGDTLCTDDTGYLKAREYLRSDAFANDFLGRKLEERKVIAADYRKQSGEATSLLPGDIMDVNQSAVESVMNKHDVTRLIHGHTHRQARHQFEINGKTCERIVLGEWHSDQGMALSVSQDGIEELLL